MIGQGLVLMLAGMGIVYTFLVVLVVVTKIAMKGISRLDHILPNDAPKKPASKAVVGNDDANIALAIAVAIG